ncbi:MAG: DNA-directed RNA polymerase subunit omega [Thermoguttaceae bacterium]|nr:DNA-directed RNA polymerase subunit omega [Thermoguttaceae bacterium]MBR3218906.1 DNA-directed RNA polymerase subunit omega [Thermoguttaceae bacterium]
MIDELRDEKLIEKVGGRFRLSALIQKRLAALNEQGRSLLTNDELAKKDNLQIVIQEILQDHIYLDESDNLAVRSDNGDSQLNNYHQ